MNKPLVKFEDLGNIPYQKALKYQQELHRDIIDTKRNSDSTPVSALLFCEHNPVYTIGKSGDMGNLLFNQEALAQQGIEFYKTNRGGDITYHGPGQITGYPILDLDQFYHDLHRYVRDLEQVAMNVLGNLDIDSVRLEGLTGVWLPKSNQHRMERKICAIGVHMSRWVSMHGFALNVNTNLSHFGGIIPCGIQQDGKAVTSMELELGRKLDLHEIKELLIIEFQNVFGFDLI